MTTPAARNHVIDAARAASIVIVVIFHALLYQVALSPGGPIVTPWAAPRWFYPVTWVFMCIPVFFFAGGFAHALMVDKMTAAGQTYAHFIVNRGRRLVGPLLVFVSVCAVAATGAAWAGHLHTAAEISRQLMQLLWFVTVYLFVIALAPWLVRAHDRAGVPLLVALAVGASLVDAWSFTVGEAGLRNVNMMLVWPLAHQLGVAYERGWWRRGPAWTPWASLALGATGIGALIAWAGYPATSVGFADLPIANVQPPTLAMALLALAQAGVLGLVERSGLLATPGRRVSGAIGVLNALMVTIYLWHIPVIIVAGGLLLALSLAAPVLAPVALTQVSVAVAALALLAAATPLIGRLDLALIPPLGDRQSGALALAAFGVLFAGTLAVWQDGTVLHPSHPVSTLGVLGVWAGALLMARAANSRGARRPGIA